MPLWRKKSPQPSKIQKPANVGVEASCIHGENPFHTIRMDLRIWSPSLASVKKHEAQAVQVKGRRKVGSIGEVKEGGEGGWGGRDGISAW